MKKAALTVVFAGLLSGVLFPSKSAVAQYAYSREPGIDQPKFQIDVAHFSQPGQFSGRLEVYYKIPYDGLRFAKEKNRYRARYEMAVVINDQKGKQVDARTFNEDILLDTYQQTQLRGDLLINQLNFELLPGQYKILCTLTDQNTNASYSIKQMVKTVPVAAGKISLSDIEFARTVFDSSEAGRFQKGRLFVLPSVARVYSDTLPTLQFYYEIYNQLPQSGSYQIQYRINHRQRGKMLMDTATVFLAEGVNQIIKALDVRTLPPGIYTLVTVVRLPKGRDLSRREAEFALAWSLPRLLKYDFKTAVEQLRYIASSKEINALKKARIEDRQKRWEEFWKSKDPTPSTPENEAADEYFRRIDFTNANFTIGNKEGWRTDLGRIYIIYGEPDQVENHPFERESKPFVVWYYYQNTRTMFPRTFVFVDRDGFGDYELQWPYDGIYFRR